MERGYRMAESIGDRKGSFRITRSGSIEYRIGFYDDAGTRRIKSFTGDTKEECLARADEFIRKHEMRLLVIKTDATILDVIEAKINNDYAKNYIGEAGYDRSLYYLSIIQDSFLADIPIKRVDTSMLSDFLDGIREYSNSVIRKVYGQLRMAFKLAYGKKLIEHDPFTSGIIQCPRSERKDKVVRAMTEEEQKQFIEVLNEHKVPYGRGSYRLQLMLELYTGMRMGEINALKPEDINFKGGYIHIKATIARGRNSKSYYKPYPKTDAGVRDVPISHISEGLLREALAEMRDNKEGLIFYDFNKDDVVETHQVASFYRRVCAKTKIPCCGQHALRHTFATRCIEAGVPAIVLQKWLGHTNIHITLDRYTDVFERMHLSSVDKLEGYIDRIREEEFSYAA